MKKFKESMKHLIDIKYFEKKLKEPDFCETYFVFNNLLQDIREFIHCDKFDELSLSIEEQEKLEKEIAHYLYDKYEDEMHKMVCREDEPLWDY